MAIYKRGGDYSGVLAFEHGAEEASLEDMNRKDQKKHLPRSATAMSFPLTQTLYFHQLYDYDS
jgi:hypothetical protein